MQTAYHQAEFVALKNEIGDLLKSNAANFQYAILASAGIYAWIAGADRAKDHCPIFALDSGLLPYVFGLPFVISCFFGVISLGVWLRLQDMGIYIKRLEDKIGHLKFGWEKYLAEESKLAIFSRMYVFGWLILVLGNLYLAMHLPGPAPACTGAVIAVEHAPAATATTPVGPATAMPLPAPSESKK